MKTKKEGVTITISTQTQFKDEASFNKFIEELGEGQFKEEILSSKKLGVPVIYDQGNFPNGVSLLSTVTYNDFQRPAPPPNCH